MKREERENEINHFERRLTTKFPRSYRIFLLERGEAVVRGFRIFGIPEREGGINVLKATQALREAKKEEIPEINKFVVVVSLEKDLDLERRSFIKGTP